jgi:small subunit ribosomal protein S27e
VTTVPEQSQDPIETFERGTFARVECDDCGHQQVLFVRAATTISCEVCGSTLAEPTGGVANLVGDFVEYVERSTA